MAAEPELDLDQGEAARATPRPAVGRALLVALGAGLLGGAVAGAGDAAWSWRPAAQFLAGAKDRLGLVGYCAGAYALVGAALAVLWTVVGVALLRGTRLGDVLAFLRAEHERRRQRDPGSAISGLAMALAGVPALGLALAVAHRLAMPLMARRNPELVVASIVAMTVAALALAGVTALFLARGLELPLGRLAQRGRLGRALTHWLAPGLAAGALTAVGAALLLTRTWETARLLPLRPLAATLAVMACTAASVPAARAALLVGRGRSRWQALMMGGSVTLAAMALGRCGDAEPVMKAARDFTGLGGPVARVVRRAIDRDRDGFSPLLGGGDCDDGDDRVHPGAIEVPGDGIDQNCLAGDASDAEAAPELRWRQVPPTAAGGNLLLITIDTLRADHLGAYGYSRPTSPAIDQLAAEGTVFVNAWAHAPSTRYSMPAILSGRLPLEVAYDHSISGWPGLAPEALTLAEVVRPLGLVTGAITNYWYFDQQHGLAQGFDEHDNDNARLHAAIPGQGPAATRGSSAREQTDKAIEFVQRHRDQRWLLWVHYYDPHYEYEPHPDVPAFGEGRVDRYDGEIRYTDDQLRRLLAALRDVGLYDRTVIAITGDHGEGFGEHGVDLHGYHLYAAQTKVPLIIRVPGLAARRSTTPVGHVDVLPTLANLAGADPHQPSPGAGTDQPLAALAMGQSLVELLTGAPDRERTVWQQLSFEGAHEQRGAATGRCHVIYHASPTTSWEAYLVDRDPDETRDVIASGQCDATRAELERWHDATSASAAAARALLPGRPELQAPLMLDLGAGARLLALTAPGRVRAGDKVTIEWTFEARAAMAPGWKVFVHVEGPSRFTGDHAPPLPLEWWRPGQYVRYSSTLHVPTNAPAGRYTLWVGLWRGAKRQPAHTAVGGVVLPIEHDRAAVATLEVAP